MKNQLDITIVVDRSGSMETIRKDVVGGLNAFLSEQRNSDVDTVVTIHRFDSVYETVYDRVSPNDIPDFTRETYVPRGSTALLDAIGKTIIAKGNQLASLPEHDRPDRVMVVILTDGEENSSVEFRTKQQISDMIRHQEERYNWEFVYLGANQDAIKEGTSLGFKSGSSMTYKTTSDGVRNTLRCVSRKTLDYAKMSNEERECLTSGGIELFDETDRSEAVR